MEESRNARFRAQLRADSVDEETAGRLSRERERFVRESRERMAQIEARERERLEARLSPRGSRYPGHAFGIRDDSGMGSGTLPPLSRHDLPGAGGTLHGPPRMVLSSMERLERMRGHVGGTLEERERDARELRDRDRALRDRDEFMRRDHLGNIRNRHGAIIARREEEPRRDLPPIHEIGR